MGTGDHAHRGPIELCDPTALRNDPAIVIEHARALTSVVHWKRKCVDVAHL